MGTVQGGNFYSSYKGNQIDLLLAAMAQANPLPSGTDWVAFIDDCTAAQEAAETAQAAAEAAAAAAETWASNPPYIDQTTGNWFVYDTETEQFVNSGVHAQGPQGATGASGADGADGVSPAVAITEITDGHRVTITDADHPSGQSFDVDNGADGSDGTDGVSPEVTISTISGGHRVTITDADHPSGQSFDVMDGSGSGDMQASTYDPQGAVAAAGGIPAYVTAQLPSVPSASSASPQMDGTAAAGSSTSWARGDHVHPSDTSKLDAPSGGTTGDVLTKTSGGVAWQTPAAGGVSSFNGRTGAVTPQSGDYTAAMVGAQTNMGFVEDTTYSGCFYRLLTGNVKEWLNPPLIYGEEYRTTERFDGKPVYVQLIGWDSGFVISQSDTTRTLEIFDLDEFVSFSGYAIDTVNNKNYYLTLPYDGSNYFHASLYREPGSSRYGLLVYSVDTGVSAISEVNIVVKYTKVD